MLTTMATAHRQTRDDGFRRQVTFRIGSEDAALLDAAAWEHGGIQAGILAALRAYAAQRLQAGASASPPSEAQDLGAPARPEDETSKPRKRQRSRRTPPAPTAPPAHEERVELNVGEAAPILGLSPSALRAQIKSGRHPGRLGATGFYLAELSKAQLRQSGAELSPRGAAEVLGLRPGTVKSHCRAGRYPNARNDGSGWVIPVADLL